MYHIKYSAKGEDDLYVYDYDHTDEGHRVYFDEDISRATIFITRDEAETFMQYCIPGYIEGCDIVIVTPKDYGKKSKNRN